MDYAAHIDSLAAFITAGRGSGMFECLHAHGVPAKRKPGQRDAAKRCSAGLRIARVGWRS
ncbi:hypothetical protein KCP70_15595 [Salmonella enterica subsp. enterica]|nr:hypothetical protein KCP70_15595 [Salmonella enterica subsp. enterica]